MSIAQHLYDEMMRAMNGNNIVRDALERQAELAVDWIDFSLQKGGLDVTGEILNDFIEINSIYEGSRPDIESLVDFTMELNENGINRGTSRFTEQVRGAGEYGSLDTFYEDADGNQKVAPSPNRQEDKILDSGVNPIVDHPLKEAWEVACENHQKAVFDGDEYAASAAQRVMDSLRQQIGDAPLKSEGKPAELSGVKPEPVKTEPAQPEKNYPDYTPEEATTSDGYVPPPQEEDDEPDEATYEDSDGMEHYA